MFWVQISHDCSSSDGFDAFQFDFIFLSSRLNWLPSFHVYFAAQPFSGQLNNVQVLRSNCSLATSCVLVTIFVILWKFGYLLIDFDLLMTSNWNSNLNLSDYWLYPLYSCLRLTVYIQVPLSIVLLIYRYCFELIMHYLVALRFE